MKQNVKKILALLLALVMCLEPVGNVAAAKMTGREQDDVMSNAGSLEMSGNDSVGHLLAETLSEEQGRQEALAESGDYITELEISGNQASVDFCTTTNAEVIVAIYEEKTGRMIGSGKTVVGIQDFSADMSIDTGSNTMPQYFIATAYLLDAETHYPLCEELTVDLYTENMQKLLSSTVNDYPDNPVVNLDDNLSTNFAVGNKDMLALNEDTEPYQIMDNGDGTYTVKNADDKITGLHAGDTLSYEYADGSILLIKVSDIAFDGNTVIITEEKDVDLTDFFDYIKIEADSYGCEMKLEEVPGSDIDAQMETDSLDIYNQHKIKAWEDEGSFSQSFSVPISKKWKGITLKGSANLGFTATIKYYLSLNYQYISTKIEYSLGGSVDISGKLEMLEIPLMRVELPILPCVNVGFTPSFVVQASGKIALSVELKGTIGVEYDSNNGMRNLCKAPSTSSKLEITGTIFIGIKATPYVGIISADLAKIKLDMTAGIEAKAKKRLLSSSSDDKHECKLCFDGTLNTKLSATAGMDLIKDLVKLEAKIAEINLENGNFYFSADYGEFGWSTCPHIKYKTTINAIDVKGNTVAGAKLVIKNKYTNANVPIETPGGKNENAVTDDSGKIDVYLGNGSYIIEAATDDMSGTKNFTVHDRKTSGKITLIENFNSDITTDPDKRIVEIKAVDESRKPVAGAAISCAKLDKTYKTDLNGMVTLKLTSGTYDLLFKTDTLTGYVQINVENDNVNETVIMKSVAHGVIHLTVVDESGNSISDVQILGTGLPDTPQTDKNGKAIFELEVGKQYSLSAKKGGVFGSHSFTVQEGEQNVQIEMKMETFSWELNDGVLKIFGNGNMPNYSSNSLPEWCGSVVKKVIIMDGITSVGNYAFWKCRYLADIEFPASITEIGVGSFYDCDSLVNINFPEGLVGISNRAFYDCDNLVNINFPESLKSIWKEAFGSCEKLQDIKLPTEMENMGIGAFRDCKSLKKIKLPSKETYIQDEVFSNCSGLTGIELPAGIKSIGIGAFLNCSSLTNIELSASITSIGGRAFSGCSGLTSMELPDGITRISDEIFKGCSSLRSVSLPDGITLIGYGAFNNCSNLTNINLPSCVTSIGEFAFSGCESLTNIELPVGISSIGHGTFSRCRSLTNINLPNGVTSIGDSAFSGCRSLTNINLPDGMASIGGEAFSYCLSLTNIKLPNGITSIEESTFSSCSSLTNIELPTDVTSIEDWAFLNCKSLTSIKLPDGLKSIGRSAFSGCSSLISIDLPVGITSIAPKMFLDCSSLEDIKLLESIKAIGESAFENCKSLTNVSLPKDIVSIPSKTFSGCSNLVNVDLQKNIESIGDYAFDGCSLTGIELPESIKSIGKASFANCCSLVRIELPESVTSIGGFAFDHCSNLKKIKLPTNITSIEGSTFYSCTSLMDIELPASIKSIGSEAFWGCDSLTSLKFPSGLNSVGNEAFAYCDKLPNMNFYFTGDWPFDKKSALPGSNGDDYDVFFRTHATVYYPKYNSTWDGVESIDFLGWVTWIAYDPSSLESRTLNMEGVADQISVTNMKMDYVIREESLTFLSLTDGMSKSDFYTDLMPEASYIFAVVKDENAEDLLSAKNLVYIKQGIANNSGQIEFSYSAETIDGSHVIYGPSNKDLANALVKVGKITADGTIQYPDVSVVYNGIELEENTDFKLRGDTRITDAGTYSLTVKGINDYSGSKIVTYTTSNADVKPDLNISIKIAGTTNLKNGSTVQLIAEISPADAEIKSLLWSSDNLSVAIVDQNGLVTGKEVGKAKITVKCTSADGREVSASCMINVEKSNEDSNDTGLDVDNPDDNTNNDFGGGSAGGTTGGNTSGGGSSGGSSSSGGNPSGGGSSGANSSGNGTDNSNGTPSGDNNRPDDSIQVKLLYYIIEFNANGGTRLSRNTMTLLNDDNLGILPKVQRENCIFNGWYTQKSEGTKVSSSTVLNAGTTLFAQWTKVDKPSKVKAPTLKSQKTGQLAVSFQKIAGAEGYEIAYSTNKKFPSSSAKKTVSASAKKTLKKLKSGKKYYVRVRAYKLDSTGRKIYGAYSKAVGRKVK